MLADWNNYRLRELYDKLTYKKPEDLTDEEKEFCFEMYLQEEYQAGLG